jgi:cytochrome b561
MAISARGPAAPRYGSVAIALHWLLAVGLLAQIALGWWMLGVPKEPPGLRAGWFNLHKSWGLTMAVFVLMRLLWRVSHPVAPPGALPRWQQWAARLNHAGLYLCMLAMPLSGYLGSTFSGYPVRYFGVVLPAAWGAWPAAKEAMSVVHGVTAVLFTGLIAMHIAAALWHARRHDGVWARMAPPALKGSAP